jgi:hypothetical protein
MAKEPRDRFGSMDELCTELSACLRELDGTGVAAGAETMVVAPRRRRRQRPARPPVGRPSVWPLIMLLAGLAVLAGILAAVFAFTDSPQKIREAIRGNDNGGGAGKAIKLSGVAAYDPFGDQREHDDAVRLATDGDPATFWTTEHYSDFTQTKDGVGIVLDAGGAQKLSKLVVASGTPGFTAEIKSGSSSTGPFTSIVSGSQTVGGRTTFDVTGGVARYYVVWITDLGASDHAEISEVTALGG